MPNAPKLTEADPDKLTEAGAGLNKMTEGVDAFQVRYASGPRFALVSPRPFIAPPTA